MTSIYDVTTNRVSNTENMSDTIHRPSPTKSLKTHSSFGERCNNMQKAKARRLWEYCNGTGHYRVVDREKRRDQNIRRPLQQNPNATIFDPIKEASNLLQAPEVAIDLYDIQQTIFDAMGSN
ncbi:1962_t:CDS:2 [Ambispora gerdemannii]|uniref:1962_t:CDS:1 n=1 Tax=Ambispora gerdemannii TaxID=144530 RepID=A0A9N8ZSM3_9GLOM|nr:1962_t:CDS:2 [Ambispora gerdemannii]